MRILIADDHGIVRQGLRSLIEGEPEWEVVGEASNGRAAVEMSEQLCPDVVIMDITMPGLNGVDATRQIRDHNPNIKVVVLSVHVEPHIVGDVFRAGAWAYVLKINLFEELCIAIRSAAAGEHFLSPRINDVLIDEYLRGASAENRGKSPGLTSREREIIQLITEGKTTKQAALMLHISPKTVDAARRHAMEKLDISSVAELTKYAIREGITSIDC